MYGATEKSALARKKSRLFCPDMTRVLHILGANIRERRAS